MAPALTKKQQAALRDQAKKRVAEAKRLLLESGGKRISVNLTARAVTCVDRYAKRNGCTQSQAIIYALERLG